MKRWFPPVILVAAFVLFRAPALLNPGFINSDGAIAGLQANRMIEGEWAWLHWARDYLTSIDSVMALPFLVLFGSTPLVLMCVTLLGQLVSAGFAYAIASNRLGPWQALVVSLPLVFMTMGLNIYLFFNIRQWCMALVLCGFWLVDRSAEAARPRLVLTAGILVGFTSMFVDLFAAQFLPGLLLFALLSTFENGLELRPLPPRFFSVLSGSALGIVLVKALRSLAEIHTGRASLDTRLITRNWPLFAEQCFPWLIGAKIFAFAQDGNARFVSSAGWLWPLQVIGLITFVGLLASGAGLFFVGRIPWRVRVLGAVGSGVAFTSCFGFLCSGTAVDIWGTRLLMPVILSLPLTLAPLAQLAGRRMLVVLSPSLLMAAIGAWLSYGVFVDGAVPVRTERGSMAEDRAVGEFLRERGVRYAAADYWVAYRLSFIFGENPIVVPEASEDRYPKWRERFDAASNVAYLVHPSSPALTVEGLEASLAQRNLAFEKATVRGYTVLLVDQHP